MQQSKIKKRNGSLVNIDFKKIQTRITLAGKGLKVDPLEISMKVIQGVYDGVTTTILDQLAADTAASYVLDHPDYSKLAGEIAISSLHKETTGSFTKVFEKMDSENLLDPLYKEKCLSYGLDKISKIIDYQKDFKLEYFGFKTLERSYLVRIKKVILERPQDMYMREAITVTRSFKDAVETYDILSNWGYTHATPTMFNSGLKNQQLASCFLINNKGDSKDGLLDTLKDVSIISSGAGGLGISISGVRAAGSDIHSSGGHSNGLMPMLRTYNESARWWDQGGGKRKGSFAMYLEPWHSDIMTLLDIRKNHGAEDLRARDLFPALWIPDLFMERVNNNGTWCLTCPNEQLINGFTRLDEIHSEEFNIEYHKIEQAVTNGLMHGKIIKAQDIWTKIIESQIETGTPYMLYKDAANNKSNQKNLGTIKSSNLCTEIIEYSAPDEQAVCNLASINLTVLIKDGEVDYDQLYKVTKLVTKNLNTVIDVSTYPTKETEYSNLKNRPIGLGVQGLADLFAQLKLPFTSIPAKEINSNIFEVMYKAALDASVEEAIKFGSYNSFPGSPASEGILQFDMWGVKPKFFSEAKWNVTRERIKKHGLRNSLFLAPMPTASTAQIMGNNEAFEPFKNNMFVRRVLSGEFNVVNKYLVADLEKEGLWGTEIKNKIISDDGSIQNIPEIPVFIKELYPTIWEVSMKDIIDMAADRGAFIDQSQSMNLWLKNPTFNKISSMHFYGWRKGLKTGMYYLRTKSAVGAIKTLGISAPPTPITTEDFRKMVELSKSSPEDCEMCGS
jgi:ribonucleoside-diphosphate reductase alpha chain